ncbi:hypothetical protein G6F46_011261 [Rhizopus delemar]|nr:hypothetical protein G6F55_010342 [Rhizopus delemar]KAG1531359.1 hypothetical protein G6F51_013548 [Rhizopus arrhizus]KAG1489705.1 hypothetical protein G6F53_013375 [Rhizopus delemar]KAG1494541.1 hypothetical protein G6F52_013122 [Rhizopus delemar]KAG1495934.1 hypothetical protein G6F54_006824 [Rhizopus delemar]
MKTEDLFGPDTWNHNTMAAAGTAAGANTGRPFVAPHDAALFEEMPPANHAAYYYNDHDSYPQGDPYYDGNRTSYNDYMYYDQQQQPYDHYSTGLPTANHGDEYMYNNYEPQPTYNKPDAR